MLPCVFVMGWHPLQRAIRPVLCVLVQWLAGCEDDAPPPIWSRNAPDAAVMLWSIPTAVGKPSRTVPRVDLGDAGKPAASSDTPLISRPFRLFADALRLGFDIVPRAFAVADLTGDGLPDIAVTDGTTLNVLAQTSSQTFVLARQLPLGNPVPSKVSLVIADLNGDRHKDVAVNLGRAVAISYFRDKGLDPVVTSHVLAPAADSFGLAVGKFGTDDRNGLVTLTETAAHIYTQLAGGGFAAPIERKFPASAREPVAVGDLNADGRDDIVNWVKGDELECAYAKANLGTGYASPVSCGLTQFHFPASGAEGISAADFDGDGTDDIVFSRDGWVDVLSLSNNRVTPYRTPAKAGPVLVGDINGDGLLDVIIENETELLLHRNDRSAGIAESMPIAAPKRHPNDPTGIVTDLDGDQQLDVLLGREDGLYVLYGLRDSIPREPQPNTLPADACTSEAHNLPVTGCSARCQHTPETCNARDDNCNDTTDEDSTGMACGSAVGECSVGEVTSCGNGWAVCSGQLPRDETCDHLDNDCDGRVDETAECDPCRGPGYRPDSVFAMTDADIAALKDVTCIGGQFQIDGSTISDLSPLSKLRVVVGDMWVMQTDKLESLKGLSSLERVGRLFVRENRGLTTVAGIETLRTIDTFHLFIEKNSKLVDLNGLAGLEHVEDELLIFDNPVLADIRGLRNLRYAAYANVHGNPSLPQCQVDSLVAQLETKITCTECTNNGQGSCAK